MRTEKVLTILLFIAFLFRFMHWPGGNILMLLSLMSLTFLYFPLAFYFFSDKTFKNQNFAVSIIFGWLLSIIPIGITFKLMFWPGSQAMILISCLTASILLIIAFILFKKASEELKNYHRNLLIRTSILTFAAIIMLAIPDEAMIRFQYLGRPEISRLQVLHYQHPENEDYKRQIEAYEKMESIQMNGK